MDFRLVLDKLTKAFADQDIRYAVIGGFALGFWGVPRSTVDLNLLVDRDDLDKLDIVMKDLFIRVQISHRERVSVCGAGETTW